MATKPSLALIPSGYKASKLYSVLPSDGVGDFNFSRSNQTATRVNKDGLIELVDSNVPRLNYPMIDGVVSGCPSLLLEPSRTNLVQYSEAFDNAYWTKSHASVTGGFISPDGTANAFKLVESATTQKHSVYKLNMANPNIEYSYSFFAKKGNRDFVYYFFAGVSNTASVYFDLNNGVVGSTNVIGKMTLSDTSIEAFANGWYKCSLTFTQTEGASLAIGVSDIDYGAVEPSYQGDGTSGIYIWGAQLEVGSYPTSYIPTNGSSVTRSAETCTGAGDAATFNDSEGVLMVEISALGKDTNYELISISDGTNNIHIDLGYNNTTTESYKQVKFGGDNVFGDFTDPIDQTTFNKIAVKYKSGDSSFYVNGFEIDSSSTEFTPISSINELKFSYFTGGDNFYGNTKQIQYFDTALTDTDLEELTSWTSFNEMAQAQLYSVE